VNLFSQPFSKTLAHFQTQADANVFQGILRGLEKESLRITPDGKLSQQPHPVSLGAALTHPHITTDYSEALLEFITSPHDSIPSLLQELHDIQRYTFPQLIPQQEILWPASMPAILTGDDNDIPVAQYGSSNSGRMKTIYRLGLGHRYGRAMQTIAGIHYNFSLPDSFWLALQDFYQDKNSLQEFKNRGYFALIRNFRRYFWLLVYLFGASPAVCSSFLKGRDHKLQKFPYANDTCYLPYATSLRMGDLGYQSDAQKKLIVNYNSVPDYLKTLGCAITASHADYEKLGVKNAAGEYQQLNTSLLQIENEFYSSIRPKRTAKRGETALQALRLHGVEYIEVRCIDLNPYEHLGITETQIQVMDAFLLFCILHPSPETHEAEFLQGHENQCRVVNRGREKGLLLQRGEGEIGMQDWANEILQGCMQAAQLLDQINQSQSYQLAVKQQLEKVKSPGLTPSAIILKEMKQQNLSFYKHNHQWAIRHAAYFLNGQLPKELLEHYSRLAQESWEEQKKLEADTSLSFDEYLQQYFAQYQVCKNC
jgi:glutamate--cysteine ligase